MLFFPDGVSLDQIVASRSSDRSAAARRAAPARRALPAGDAAHAAALEFVGMFADPAGQDVAVTGTTDAGAIDRLVQGGYTTIANVSRLNDIRRINRFLEAVNGRLARGGRFIGCVETAARRSQRHRFRHPRAIADLLIFIDWIWLRVCPKLPVVKRAYFAVTQGRNRVLTLTEALGRLYCCGFRLEHMEERGGLTFFSVLKDREPSFDANPSYGPLFRMRRIGRHGKEIVVWKIRTMHAYAEYLQEYVYEVNRLDTGCKFKDDFRVSAWGRALRRVWIDELPMIWNLLRGDLKLVGVRPLSGHYLSLLSHEARARRQRYTPGLIPPYYADLPKSLDQFVACEQRYFDAYDRHPIRADVRYLCVALYNIVVRGARSG